MAIGNAFLHQIKISYSETKKKRKKEKKQNYRVLKKDYSASYPIASSLWICSFLALRTAVSFAPLVTAGVYGLNLLLGAPQTALQNTHNLRQLSSTYNMRSLTSL